MARTLEEKPRVSVKERLAKGGMDVVASTPERYTEFVQSEMKKWEAVIRATGIKVE
mgnify:CR=1 FL=1